MAVPRNCCTARITNIDSWFPAIYLCLLSITVIPPVASQPGFLSIDCGSSKAYTDDSTGIFWQTDAEYISTGTNYDYGDVLTPFDPSFNITKQLGTIRHFTDTRPKHDRDCYVLPSTPQKRYIIRPIFAVIDASPFGAGYTSSEFDLYLNSTFIRRIQTDYDNARVFFPVEIIFQSTGNLTSVCLVRRVGDSFMTSLELRELQSGMYDYVGGSLDGSAIYLDKVQRGSFGSHRSFYRYPDDPYDRFWKTYDSSHILFRSFSDVENRSRILASTSPEAPNLPPVSVMEQALVSYDSKILDFIVNGPAGLLYIAGYFQELDGNASATNVRGIDLLVNDQLIGSFNSSNQVVEVQAPIANGNKTRLNITIAQASWSRLPPMINAMEVYTVGTFNKSRTAQEDVDAVSMLKAHIPQLSEGKGDPCLPVPFYWLECGADNADPTNFRITGLFLENLNICGPIPQEIFKLTELSVLSLSNTNLTGSIPDFSNLSLLQSLSLRNNNLDGEIQNLTSLVHLQELYLENNSFTGSITSFFSSFPNLIELHVDNNNFSGVIPASVKNKMGVSFSFAGNPALKLSGPSSGLSTRVIVGIIFGSLFVLTIVPSFMWYLLTRKRRARDKILQEIHKAGSNGLVPQRSRIEPVASGNFGSLPVFTLRQVSEATQKFSKKIGEGSFGSVFYGRLPNGREAAVKVRKEASRQGLPEFINELELLSRIHHRNLVSLLGYCQEGSQQILLYAYLPNGTLGGYLHYENEMVGEKNLKSRTEKNMTGAKKLARARRKDCTGTTSETKSPLPWKTRLKIAVDAATGLEYLHFHCNPYIIHRDVKSANILLDGKMVAKVADFGISKQSSEEMTSSGVNTAVKGTFGYMDPELLITERLTRQNDVYSFGIVLLEIISGCHPRPIQLNDGTVLALVDWARNCVRDGTPFDVFDPALENKFSYQSARMALDLALQCSNSVLSRRPDMRQVVRVLAQAEQLEDVEQSRMLSSEDQAELHRNFRLGKTPDELQNEEEYILGDFSTTGEPYTRNTSATYDTTDVEAR